MRQHRRLAMLALPVVTLALGLGAPAPAQGKVALNFWTVGAAADAAGYDRLFAEFERQNPGVDVNVQLFPDNQYPNALNLAFRGGGQPDVLRVGFLNIPVSAMVENGWLLPLDRFVSAGLLSRFPTGSVQEGTAKFGGRLYTLPLGQSPVQLLYYNKKLLAESGLSRPPATWSELRSYARKITETGRGRYYGFATPPFRSYAMALAQVAGYNAPNLGVPLASYRTGRGDAANPALVSAVNLLRAINLEDKAFLPGWESSDIRKIAEALAAGQVGLTINDSSANGNLRSLGLTPADYGIAPLPAPDGRRNGRQLLVPLQGTYGVAAKTRQPGEAWQLMDFLHSQGGVELAVSLSLPPAVPAVRLPTETLSRLDPSLGQVLAVIRDQTAAAPDPGLREPQWQKVLANFKLPSPSPSQFIPGAISGSVDYEAAARTYNAALDAAVDAALEAARRDGAPRVCRELLAFPSFAGRSLTARDYQSLPACR